MLSEEEKRLLLNIARRSIEAAVRNSPMPQTVQIPARLRRNAGAFVTLRQHQELRGCIGYIEAVSPLADTVREAAAKAALEDPRFLPLEEGELEQLEIEISVLSPLRRIVTTDEIEIGTHGLVAVLGGRRGLLLPQVAVEFGWDRKTFLEQTCRKAGLAESAASNPQIELFVFTTENFGEHDPSLIRS